MNANVGAVDLAVIGVYLVGILAVGVLVGRRLRTFDAFLVAGRSMTAPILVCTLVSTFYGIDVLFGTSELAYEEGVVAWFTYSRPMYFFLLVAAFFLAPRLFGRGFRTLPDVLEHQYGRGTQVIGAAASFVYCLPSLGLFGLGHTFEVLFGWEPWIGALLFGGIALAYTLFGGLLAVVLTDTVQFLLMAVTLAVAVPLVMARVGGFDAAAAALPAEFFEPLGTIPLWLAFVYASTGLVVFIDPAFYQRIFAARSARHIRNAFLFGIVLWAAYDWCVTALGMLAATAAAQGLLPADMHADQALLRVVVGSLPVGLTGVFLAGLLATEMSTIDSYCLVAGGNLAHDIVRPLARPQANDEELLRWTRIGIGISWALGFVLAFAFERLLGLWVFLATALTATLLVPVLGALYVPSRATPRAGLLSSTIGLASALTLYAAIGLLGRFDEDYATWMLDVPSFGMTLWHEHVMLVAVPLSLAGFVAGSLLDRRRTRP